MSLPLFALTTTFYPAPSCFSETYEYTWTATDAPWPYHIQGPKDAPDCYPSGYRGGLSSFLSPGLVCPAGYATACTSLNSVGAVTETVATCCPIGYTCAADVSDVWMETFRCATNPKSDVPVTLTDTDGSISTRTFRPMGVNGRGVILRFQESDFLGSSMTSIGLTDSSPPAESSSSLPNSDNSGETVESSSILPTSDNSGRTADGPQNWSSRATIGIAVGVGVGGLIATIGAILAVLQFRKRRNKTCEKSTNETLDKEIRVEVGTLAIVEVPGYEPLEAPGSEGWVNELPVDLPTPQDDRRLR